MRKSRFTESQIDRVLKEVEGGRPVTEVCREYGISDATYYNWKAKYGGMELSDIKKLKDLQEENRKLKQMFADPSLKREALRDIVEKGSEAGRETPTRRLRQAGSWPKPPGSLPGAESQSLGVSLPAKTR